MMAMRSRLPRLLATGLCLLASACATPAAREPALRQAGLKSAANSNDQAPAETPAEVVEAPEATEGQEG